MRQPSRIGLSRNYWAIKLRQYLRRVLSISVKQNNHIETFIDEITVPGLLISAIPEILSWRRIPSLGSERSIFIPTARS